MAKVWVDRVQSLKDENTQLLADLQRLQRRLK